MSDEADIAAGQEELALQAALKVRRPTAPPPTGECLFCGEEIEPPQRWCDTDCRDSWERRVDR